MKAFVVAGCCKMLADVVQGVARHIACDCSHFRPCFCQLSMTLCRWNLEPFVVCSIVCMRQESAGVVDCELFLFVLMAAKEDTSLGRLFGAAALRPTKEKDVCMDGSGSASTN